MATDFKRLLLNLLIIGILAKGYYAAPRTSVGKEPHPLMVKGEAKQSEADLVSGNSNPQFEMVESEAGLHQAEIGRTIPYRFGLVEGEAGLHQAEIATEKIPRNTPFRW